MESWFMYWLGLFRMNLSFLNSFDTKLVYLNYIELQAHFSGSDLNAPTLFLTLFDISDCLK